MRIYDLIEKKKRGQELNKEEIYSLIEEYTRGDIPDCQMSALLMAIYFQGMTVEERFDLTMAMRDSGNVLDLSAINGIKVDKHSTGGVGDKVTLILGPICAAIGAPVAKMSGRGLGHTGGTIDKLEAFPGFDVTLTEEEFINQVNEIKIAVAGQSKNLAPADKKIYALRDITATVDEISLITSSVMSKKLASGADAIVLDVTVGSGAFMKDIDSARELATSMVNIGKIAGKKIVAVLTNMDEPLGFAVGNILEVVEAINCLKEQWPADVKEVVYELASYMLLFAEVVESKEEAIRRIDEVIADGSALNKLAEMVQRQKGDSSYVFDTSKFKPSDYTYEYLAKEDGYISKINATQVGLASMSLGGGREDLDDVIDMSVGVVLHKKVGAKILKDEIIATIHYNDESKLPEAIKYLDSAYEYSKSEPAQIKEILDVIS